MKNMYMYFFALLLFANNFCYADDFETTTVLKDEYKNRRKAVLSKMEPNSIAIFKSNEIKYKEDGTEYGYKQNSNLYYLTGCDESNSLLILIPDGYRLDSTRIVKAILFLDQKNKNDKLLNFKDSSETIVFDDNLDDAILANDTLKTVLSNLLREKHVLYYTPNASESLIDVLSDLYILGWRESIKNLSIKYPNLTIKNLDAVLGELRVLKSSVESGLLQKAVDIAVKSQIEAMKCCEPYMYEYQLQAIADFVVKFAGADFVAEDKSANDELYSSNKRKMQNGELMILHVGAEYKKYNASIIRTFPVSGKFTQSQKDVYDAIENAYTSIIDTINPGMSYNELKNIAKDLLNKSLIKIGVAKNISDAEKLITSVTINSMGLNVKDVGSIDIFIPNMFLSVEVGINIPEGTNCNKKYWNIGIRLKDNILVTEDGRSMLSAFAPLPIDEIEDVMKKTGFINQKFGK